MCASATLSHSLDTMPGAPANNILGLPSGYFTEWRSLGTRAFVPPSVQVHLSINCILIIDPLGSCAGNDYGVIVNVCLKVFNVLIHLADFCFIF